MVLGGILLAIAIVRGIYLGTLNTAAKGAANSVVDQIETYIEVDPTK